MRYWFLAFSLLISGVAHAEDFPSDQAVLIFSGMIRDGLGHHSINRLHFQDVRAIEHLVYRRGIIREELKTKGNWEERFALRRHLTASASKTLTFRKGNQTYSLTESSGDFVLKTPSGETTISKDAITAEYLDLERIKTESSLAASKSLSSYSLGTLGAEHHPTTADSVPVTNETASLEVRERTYGESKNDGSRWEFTPIKLIAFPATKIMYDIPSTLLSIPSESVSRSPKHNLLGVGDELKGGGMSIVQGLRDVVRGIARPSRASAIDGVLEIAEAPFHVMRAGGGVVKTAVSIVAYPLFRALGGKKSIRPALRGKRGAIITIDSGMMFGQAWVDTYGEMIVRPQLRSVADYICVESMANRQKLSDCIKNMPPSIEYVDLFALTHSGGMSDLENLAREVVQAGKRPELLISVGCDDSFSKLGASENTTGPQGTSWSVHFYLFSMLAKRLHGIPMPEAASQAYIEGAPLNFINPVSIAGMIGIAAMDGNFWAGYGGSAPDFKKRGDVVRDSIRSAWTPVLSALEKNESYEQPLKVLNATHQLLRYKRQWVPRSERRRIDRSLELETRLNSSPEARASSDTTPTGIEADIRKLLQ